MKFSYKALSRDGHASAGSVEAINRESAVASLLKQGIRPVVVHAERANSLGSGGGFKLFKPRVGNRDLVIFTRQLSVLVSAGVPLPRSLVTLEGQAESKYFKTVIAGITKDVEAGLPMGDAFAKYPHVFSEIYTNMIRAGEAGGILDQILKRVATQAEKDATIKKKIKGAMTYPIVILTITIIAFFGLMIFIIPKIGKILTNLGGPKAKLPIYTRVLLGISNFCISPSILQHIPGIKAIPILGHLPNLLILVALAIVGISYGLKYIRTPVGKLRFHMLLLKIPVIKEVIVKVAVSQFARTFSALTGAGVSVLDALEVTGGAVGNKVIENELKTAANEVKNGKPLSEPLAKSPYFPAIVSQMLAVGEETGQTDTILLKVADFYDEEVDTVIASLSAIIEPVMIIILGSLVGLIAASVMGPIAALSTNVGNN
jgi:type IV pilus assembly protein PilC